MADEKSTGSASKRKAGRPAQSIAAIREIAQRENERAKENLAKGEEAIKWLRGDANYRPARINPYTKENIQKMLQNISGNEVNLRKAMHYMFYRSQIMYRIINWYAGIWDLRCRKVTPKYDLVKSNDPQKTLKSLNDTFNILDRFKIHENMFAPLLRCYLDDVVYFIWFQDDTGAFPYILNPDWCRICGRFIDTGDLIYEVDMSQYRGEYYQELIKSLGSPLVEMYKEYERTKKNWIRMPEEYCGCFKFRISDLDNVISPFIPVAQQVAGLSDLEDIQAIADEQSIFKLIIYSIKTLSGSKVSDDWEITPDLCLQYFKKMKEYFPNYVAAAPVLGDGLEVVDFSKNSADTEVDRVKNAQNNILNVSGGGAVLSSNNITSTAAFNAWMKSESEFAISSLMPQVKAFVNRMIGYELKNPCKVDFFELTILTKDDFREKLLTACQYSFSYRLALGTLYGFSEKETLASMYVENELLGLQNKMIYPLQSSFTSTGEREEGYTPETGQGRPEIPDDELSPKGEESRNR